MPLDAYHRKRIAAATPEPMPKEAVTRDGLTHEGQFVVHGHDARRMHFDLRLEMNGALLSFACPKGASLDPEQKHLAVRTEEHPLEYVDFEDTIPAGNYGAGPMIVWDRGVVRWLEMPAEQQIERGKLDFVLYGHKLRGRFSLIPLKDPPNYLLLKKRDAFAVVGAPPLDPRSIFCGLLVAELPELRQRGQALLAAAAALPGARTREKKAALLPCRQGTETEKKLTALRWDFVPRGAFRALCTRRGSSVRIETEAGELLTDVYPDLAAALAHGLLPDYAAELLVWRPHEPELREQPAPCQALAVDVFAVGDHDLTGVALAARRALLERMFPGPGIVRALPPFDAPLERLLAGVAADANLLHGVLGRADKPARVVFVAPEGAAPWVTTHRKAPTRAAPAPRPARKVSLTNRDKPFFPGLSKGDLLDYYANVAEHMLPHLRDRPVILERFPDGVDGKHFYQWRPPQGAPSWLRSVEIPEHRKDKVREPGKQPKRAFVLDDLESLLYVANLGCIPLHWLGFRAQEPALCTFFTIDFDVKQANLDMARPLVATLRGLLERVALPSYLKTSGRTGVHVLVPLGAGVPFPAAQALCELIGRYLTLHDPKHATREERIDKRGQRIYIDTGQTGPLRAIAAPYSVRPVADARVSMPLPWDQLESLDPASFTVRTVPRLLAVHGDAWATFHSQAPDLARAVGYLQSEVAPLLARES